MKTLLLALALLASHVHAQDAWPSKPLRLILPFPPGGGTDILGRLIADNLSNKLGQPVVTENRGAAGGNEGAAGGMWVARPLPARPPTPTRSGWWPRRSATLRACSRSSTATR